MKYKFFALGSQVEVFFVAENEKEKRKAKLDAKRVKHFFLSKQKVFCRFNLESELSKLNSNLGVWQKVSPDMLYLAKRTLFYYRESGGLYDPRVIDVLEEIGYKSGKSTVAKLALESGKLKNLAVDLRIRQGKMFFSRRMDFSGIAKGHIIDLAASFLKKRGWKNFFINVNGDAYAAGRNARGEKWKLPIEGARDKKAAIFLSNRAAATSGVIKRQWKVRGKKVHHLINPKYPNFFSFEIRSVVIINTKAEWADGRAKVLILMGAKKGLTFAKKKKLRAIFVDNQGKVSYSARAKKYFSRRSLLQRTSTL